MNYYKADDVINAIEDKIAEYIPTLYGRYAEIPLELRMAIEHLPTIEVSEDCISRADAIKAYNKAIDELVKAEMEEFNLGDFTECSFNTTQLKLIARKIEDAPSVVPTVRKNRQVERAEGEWIDCDSDSNIYDDIRCSICGMKFTVDIERKTDIGFTITDLKFCPNCGAKMKG